MGDWGDEESDDIVAKKVTSCWDDDENSAVPDSWDAETTKPRDPKPAPAKLSQAERIRLKEEQRRKEKEEKLKREEELRQMSQLTESQREKLAEESELGLLKDTFGTSSENKDGKSALETIDPRTKEDFENLNNLLKAMVLKIEKSPHYSVFAEKLVRDVMIEMDLESLRSISTAVNALVNEKQKLVKGKSKKKGKGKLLVERDNDYGYDEEDGIAPDEFDDFI